MPHSGAADQATESRNDDERKEKVVISPYPPGDGLCLEGDVVGEGCLLVARTRGRMIL